MTDRMEELDLLIAAMPPEPMKRGRKLGGTNSYRYTLPRKMHCIHGHEFTEENSKWRLVRTDKYTYNRRSCRECDRLWQITKRGQRRLADPVNKADEAGADAVHSTPQSEYRQADAQLELVYAEANSKRVATLRRLGQRSPGSPPPAMLPATGASVRPTQA